MTAGWILLGMGIAIAMLLVATTSWRRRERSVDLGSVSHHWIAEQRLGAHDPQR